MSVSKFSMYSHVLGLNVNFNIVGSQSTHICSGEVWHGVSINKNTPENDNIYILNAGHWMPLLDIFSTLANEECQHHSSLMLN